MGTQAPAYHKLKTAWAERRERVLRMLEDGAKPGHVAKVMGISPSRVSHIAKRAKQDEPA